MKMISNAYRDATQKLAPVEFRSKQGQQITLHWKTVSTIWGIMKPLKIIV